MDDREQTESPFYSTEPTPSRRMYGETLTRLRQQAGLRQAEVNRAMADWGWHNLTCARLEGSHVFDLPTAEMERLCEVLAAGRGTRDAAD